MQMHLYTILFWGVSEILLILVSLGAVAFMTLLERKYLGLSQIRLGPNKVSMWGVFQPVIDGVKLLSKQFLKSGVSQSVLFMLSPSILLVFFLKNMKSGNFMSGSQFFWEMLCSYFFSFLGCSTYAVILTGWAIMSTFPKLGSLRGILQSLSYEVALILMFMIVLTLLMGYSFNSGLLTKESLFLWMVLWTLLSLMETNRAPFDLLEGESELISGFNIEMGSLMFVFLFLSEYGMIIVMSLVLSLGTVMSVSEMAIFASSIMLLARSCYPRIRYDTLMSGMWQALLPQGLVFFYVMVFMK